MQILSTNLTKFNILVKKDLEDKRDGRPEKPGEALVLLCDGCCVF